MGERWESVEIEVDGELTALAAAEDGTLAAVGTGGAIAISPDRGSSWRAIVTKVRSHLTSVAFVAEGLAAVGEDGVVLWAPRRDEALVRIGTATRKPLHDVAAGGGHAVIAGGGGKILFHAPDGTWRTAPKRGGSVSNHFATAAARSGTLYFGGGWGAGWICASTDGGVRWTSTTPSRVAFPIVRCLGASGDGVIAGCDGGVVVRWTPGSAPELLEHPAGRPLRRCAVAGDVAYVTDEAGELWRSPDGGVRWEPVACVRDALDVALDGAGGVFVLTRGNRALVGEDRAAAHAAAPEGARADASHPGDDALSQQLEAWRTARSMARADALTTLSQQLHAELSAELASLEGRALDARWGELVACGSPVALGAALEHFTRATTHEFVRRIALLAPLPPDPRVAMTLALAASRPPWRSTEARTAWTALFEQIVRIGDERVLPVLREACDRGVDVSGAVMRTTLERRLRETFEELASSVEGTQRG